MLLKNNYFKSKPNFHPPSPTKIGRDIALRCPFGGLRCIIPIHKRAEARTARAVRPYHKIGGLAFDLCSSVKSVVNSVGSQFCLHSRHFASRWPAGASPQKN